MKKPVLVRKRLPKDFDPVLIRMALAIEQAIFYDQIKPVIRVARAAWSNFDTGCPTSEQLDRIVSRNRRALLILLATICPDYPGLLK